MPFGPTWIFAVVAGDLRPSNVPLSDSVVPLSVAVTLPLPAMVLCMATSIGTVDNRARNVWVWDDAAPESGAAISSRARVRCRIPACAVCNTCQFRGTLLQDRGFH